MSREIIIDPMTRLEGHGQDPHLPRTTTAVSTAPTSRSRSCAASRSSPRDGRVRGHAADHLAHLRRLPDGPPHGRDEGPRRPLPGGPAAGRQEDPRARCTAPSWSRTTRCTSSSSAGPISSSARTRRRPSATSSASSTLVGLEVGKEVIGVRKQLRDLMSAVGGQGDPSGLRAARRRRRGRSRREHAAGGRRRGGPRRRVRPVRAGRLPQDRARQPRPTWTWSPPRPTRTAPTTWGWSTTRTRSTSTTAGCGSSDPNGQGVADVHAAGTTSTTSPSTSNRGRYMKFCFLKDDRLEGVHRRDRQRRLQRRAAGAAERRRRHGHPAGAGGLRGARHDAGRQARPPHARQPLGPHRRAACTPRSGWPSLPPTRRSSTRRCARCRPRCRARASASWRRRGGRCSTTTRPTSAGSSRPRT